MNAVRPHARRRVTPCPGNASNSTEKHLIHMLARTAEPDASGSDNPDNKNSGWLPPTFLVDKHFQNTNK